MAELINRVGLNSIQGRLTAIAFVFIIGTALTMGVAGFRFTSSFENERFHDHFNLLADYLASNAELGVLLGNEKILQGLTENMLTVSDVQSVEIRDNAGALIIRRAHPDPPEALGTATATVLSRKMEGGDSLFPDAGAAEEQLGQVVITYSYAGLEQLKETMALRFVLISLFLGMAPVFMYWTLSRAISSPLHNLLKVAAEVSRGQMDVRASGGSLQETRTLAGAINEMLDALEAKRQQLNDANTAMAKQQVLAEVGKFSMIVAHEIKNPLAIIKGSLSILRKDEPLDPELKTQMVGFIDEEIHRVNKLIEDFLLFARPRTPAFREILVLDLVANLAQRLRLMDNRILVLVEVPEALLEAELNCDVGLLERALFNVVRNALEATGDNQQVQVLIGSSGNQLDFSILDEGPGLKPEDLGGIFEPFFSTKAKGTGLGLAIAREVVNAHGGTITAANREGGGAEFNLRLPLLAGAEPETQDIPGGVCDLSRRVATGFVR